MLKIFILCKNIILLKSRKFPPILQSCPNCRDKTKRLDKAELSLKDKDLQISDLRELCSNYEKQNGVLIKKKT